MTVRYLALTGLFVLSACGVSPEPRYYDLAPVPGLAMPDIAEVIKIRRPTLAAYLDRPEFVRQEGEFQIEIQDSDYWAEPLDEMFARLLADDLQQRLPASHIITEDEFVPANIRFIVDINIDHFNQMGDRIVRLEGTLTIEDKENMKATEFFPLNFATAIHSSPASVTAGLSQLVGNAADEIEEKIRSQ